MTSRAPEGLDAPTMRVLADAIAAGADAAAAVVRAAARDLSTITWEEKRPADFVTRVDRGAESRLRDVIATTLTPALGDVPFLGEESWRGTRIPAGLSIVADPLDGTTNFLHGVPVYAISVAALLDGEPIAAIVLDVPRAERFSAVVGEGAWRTHEGVQSAMRVSPTRELSRALIGTGIPFGGNADRERYARQLVAVARDTAGIRRAGSAAIDLAWLASGRFDAFWELHLAPWDVAAGLLLVREAGGLATTLAGVHAPVADGALVAGNPAMHAWLLDTLRAADDRVDVVRA